jgi:hypothetical protein
MTPKEKAEQLFQLYLPFVESGHIEEIKNRCKRCALIAVDEILAIFYDDIQSMWADELSYWHQVKKEIENL